MNNSNVSSSSFYLDRSDSYKCLDGGVYFAKEIPLKRASGKIDRVKVKEMVKHLFQSKRSK